MVMEVRAMPNDIQLACERAWVRVGQTVWSNLSSKAQSDAIYAEFRAIDAERSAAQSKESAEAAKDAVD